MGYKVIVKPLAESDIVEALEWYSKQAEHLPGQFLNAVDEAIENLQGNPYHYQKRYRELRIQFVKTFPYGIYFTIQGNVVFVHAVLHTRRDPTTGTTR